MTKRRLPLTQLELTRYMKAARSAGLEEFRVEILNVDGSRVSIVAPKLTPLLENGDEIDAMIDRAL